jgi:predicted sulfurtransferase
MSRTAWISSTAGIERHARHWSSRIGEENEMVATVKQLIEAADAVVPRITPAQAKALITQRNALVVDVRDAPELEKKQSCR